MKLTQLLRGVNAAAVKGDKYLDIENISYDSKQVRPRTMFFAIKGTKANGADFIDEAIERGAICVVSDTDFISIDCFFTGHFSLSFREDLFKSAEVLFRNHIVARVRS